MAQEPNDAAAKALAFANGLRRSVAGMGGRWAQWPHGADDLTALLVRLDAIRARLQAAPGDEAAAAAAFADLRAILEWTTYQSAAISTARALIVARRTRAFAERFGLFSHPGQFTKLADSEESFIENIRVRNAYMVELGARHPHLAFPTPLVGAESLAPKPERKPGRLDLIQRLVQSVKRK